MYHNMIFSGVGGQGVLSVASLLINAALAIDLNVKQTEIHGMAQRGGAVTSQVRLADGPIHSAMIPKGQADFIVATEPMEALRQLDFLKPDGWVIAAMTPVKNIAYPDLAEVHNAIKALPHHRLVDTQKIQEEIANPRAANIILLGALIRELKVEGLVKSVQTLIEKTFAAKGGAVVASNLLALEKGMRDS